MKKSAFLLIYIIFSLGVLCAGTKKEKFLELFESRQYDQIEAFLDDWEKENPNDADVNLCRYLYYREQSQRPMIIQVDEPSDDRTYFGGTDENGNRLWFYMETRYDSDFTQKAILALDEGISKNSRRLDLYVEKADYLQACGRYEDCSEEIKRIIRLNRKNAKKWLMAEDLSAGEKAVEEGIQGVISALMLLDKKEVDIIAKELVLLAIRSFSKNADFQNDAGLLAVYEGDYNSALKYFTTAHSFDPKNPAFLTNLAVCCEEKGSINEAITYYKELLSLEDDEAKYLAARKLEILSSN